MTKPTGIELLPKSDLQRERLALRGRIAAAFRGVRRGGGVSWTEAAVIDGYGTPEEERAARLADPDTDWTELVVDPDWRSHPGCGGFSFLDAGGFRYYLPAAMTKCLDELDDGPYVEFAITLTALPGRRDTGMQQWSLLNQRQRKCVAAFVRFMHSWDEAHFGYDTGWQEALDQYWGTFPAKE